MRGYGHEGESVRAPTGLLLAWEHEQPPTAEGASKASSDSHRLGPSICNTKVRRLTARNVPTLADQFSWYIPKARGHGQKCLYTVWLRARTRLRSLPAFRRVSLVLPCKRFASVSPVQSGHYLPSLRAPMLGGPPLTDMVSSKQARTRELWIRGSRFESSRGNVMPDVTICGVSARRNHGDMGARSAGMVRPHSRSTLMDEATDPHPLPMPRV